MNQICPIDGCNRSVRKRGYCANHYEKYVRRAPDFQLVRLGVGTQVPWLKEHVSYVGDDCLKWPFAFYKDGRGQVTINNHTLQAHREMCRLAHGEPPTPKHDAAHLCGKGHEGCVNPKHLAWKTHTENMADQLVHGTRIRGEKSPHAVLTEGKVRAIREFAHTCSLEVIADIFGVTSQHVGKIVNRKRWSHVT